MANYKEKLSREEVEKIFYKLCLAISEMRDAKESAELMRDLLSLQEAEMIAKRLKIADLLMKDKTYDEIKKELRVSFGTIARVQEWLKISGEGYRRAIERISNKDTDESMSEIKDIQNWNSIKRRYPMYYWPELLLEEIVRSANKRRKEKLRAVMREMEKAKEKTVLYKKINKILLTRKK